MSSPRHINRVNKFIYSLQVAEGVAGGIVEIAIDGLAFASPPVYQVGIVLQNIVGVAATVVSSRAVKAQINEGSTGADHGGCGLWQVLQHCAHAVLVEQVIGLGMIPTDIPEFYGYFPISVFVEIADAA